MNSPIESKTLLRHNVSLSSYSTMQVGGKAKFFAEPQREEDLLELIGFAQKEGLPFTIVGKGSNVIFPDEGYPGLVITMIHYDSDWIRADKKTCEVEASAGIHLYRLVLFARDHGLAGPEFLCNVPGTLGGALVMNAGFSRYPGQTNEIGDLVWEVTVLNAAGEKETRMRDQMTFSYRQSSLRGTIILSAKLKLWKRRREGIEEEIRANFQYRNSKQDLRYPSSGSIFKNPGKGLPSAGQLIEQAGLKGKTAGGAKVSEKHCNYIVNYDRASSSDVIQLIEEVQRAVFNESGVHLEPEIQLIQPS